MIRSIEFRAMNTTVLLAAEGERAQDGIYAAKLFIDECEQRFSRFLPASELSTLNQYAGQWFHVSEDMQDMLTLSMKYYKETGGLFDPTILPDLKRVGYDRSMDEIREKGVTSTSGPSTHASRPAFNEVAFDPADDMVLMPRGMEIDLGGIAKGWIVDRAVQLLNSYVDVCGVSAGGDIQFIGHPEDGLGWDVFLEDPRDASQMLTRLHLNEGAVATSSVMKRTWSQGEKVRHHLIDPRKGEPAETDWLSVTIVAPHIIDAEVYAKVLLIGGQPEAARLLTSKPDMTYIAVDQNGNLSGSPDYKDYIHELTSDTFPSTEIAD